MNGECIPAFWHCDGDRDCLDGEDEVNCSNSNITCLSSEFQCRNKQCITAKLVCNGQNDCHDGSDEMGCPPVQCSPEEFSCGTICLPLSLMCNGKADCTGGTDELSEKCKSQSRLDCSTDEFDCDGHCIPHTWRCDGHADCEDKSDEENCDKLKKVSSTVASVHQVSFKDRWAIVVSVFLCFCLILCMIIGYCKKTSYSLLNSNLFEKSKKCLKHHRSLSSAYMMADMKNEDESRSL
ncbi:hypothetical protein GDO86_020474 [Hymenochirus boettgeri]|uniref:Uncharacterized protein n=1 Tax=Hymenochirus boettgeri TaxID=247094 RepID=A0A8T2IFP0_9PIPI|nr:hypothetical protein GDO86_020474 [Hymenochirus boettgeri]